MGHLVWKSSFKRASSFPNDCGMSSYQSIWDLINQEEEEEEDVLVKSGENQKQIPGSLSFPRLDLQSLLGKP